MKNFSIRSLVLSFVCMLAVTAHAQTSRDKIEIVPPNGYKAPKIEQSSELQDLLTRSVKELLAGYPDKSFKPEEISATVIDISDPSNWRSANYRGNERIYPASVVKMFFMAALERQLEDGKVNMTPELQRGLRDMIVDSSNEATQYILDVLTDTSSGAELPQKEFDEWQYKRNRVNRFFDAMGYTNINVNQKTFCEDAYGIEQQSRRYKGENRNMITTDATARLLAEIAAGRMNTPERTKRMMDLMKRDPFADTKDQEDQAHGFTGIALVDRKMTDAKLWSKAGWTSKARHDAAYIETPDGKKLVVAVYTENHAKDRNAIPAIAGKIIDGLKGAK